MVNLLRSLQLLALGLWLGAMVCFGFLVAPMLFAKLPTRDLAGAIVTVVLGRLNKMGIVAGIIYLVAAALEPRWAASASTAASGGVFTVRNALVVGMIVFTVYSQFVISPRMAALRTEMVSVDRTPADDPLRVAFNRYHRYSVWLMTASLLAGLAAFYLTARR